jgi:hypothetical protein
VSLLETTIIVALIIYALFLLVVLIEYLTDKRGKEPRLQEKKAKQSGPRKRIPQEPGLEEPPKEWKEEEFE